MYKIYYVVKGTIKEKVIVPTNGLPVSSYFAKEYVPEGAEVIQVIPLDRITI